MYKEQILAYAANFLKTCKCNLNIKDKLSDLEITDKKLNEFVVILKHNYGVPIEINEINNWKTLDDIRKTIENKSTSLS